MPGFDFFNVENVKQIEIIKSPSSALYGENAYWGVVNIVSISGKDLRGASVKAKAGDRETKEVGVMVGDEWAQGDWFASVKWLQSEFPTQLWQNTDGVGVQALEVFLKGSWSLGTFSYYRLEDRVDGFVEPIPQVTPTSVFRSANKLKQRVDIAAAKFDTALTDTVHMRSNFSYAKRVGSHGASCHGVLQGEFADDVIDHGYQAFREVAIDANINEKNRLVVGGELRRVNAGQHDDELGSMPGHQGMDVVTAYNKYAFYLQHQWLPNERFKVTTGIRVDSKTSPSLFGQNISPRAEVLYEWSEALRFRAGWSRAQHYPDFSTLFQNTWFINVENTGIPNADVFPMALFEPNVDLTPEQIDSWNAGFDYSVTQDLLFKLDAFWSKV